MGVDVLTEVLSKRKPKTRRGKKILKDREPKVTEDAKTALVIRGASTSNDMTTLLRELHLLRSPLAMLYMRKHEEHPFEDCSKVEVLCKKFDHSLFAFGSTSKKRPKRLILGRLFDGGLLDMQEFNVEDYKSMQKFRSSSKETLAGSKPLMIFHGSSFDTDERMKRVKSLLLDFFGGAVADQVLLSGIEQAIVCTTLDQPGTDAKPKAGIPSSVIEGWVRYKDPFMSKVLLRRYRIKMQKSGSSLPRVELEELGPSMSLSLDRTRDPDKDKWKQSIKVPKAAKPKKVKNMKTTEMGKTVGKFHLGKQDFNQIHTVHHGASKKKKNAAASLGKNTPGDAKSKRSSPTAVEA